MKLACVLIFAFPAFSFAQAPEAVRAQGGIKLGGPVTPKESIYSDHVKCISSMQTNTLKDLPQTVAAGVSGDETFAIVDSRDGKNGVYTLNSEGARFYPWPSSPSYSDSNGKTFALRFEDSECEKHVVKLKVNHRGDGTMKPCGFSINELPKDKEASWWVNYPEASVGYTSAGQPFNIPPQGLNVPVVRGKDVTDKKTTDFITMKITNYLLKLPGHISYASRPGGGILPSWIKSDLDKLFCGCKKIMEENKLTGLRNLPEVLMYLPKNKSLSCDLISRL